MRVRRKLQARHRLDSPFDMKRKRETSKEGRVSPKDKAIGTTTSMGKGKEGLGLQWGGLGAVEEGCDTVFLNY